MPERSATDHLDAELRRITEALVADPQPRPTCSATATRRAPHRRHLLRPAAVVALLLGP